MSNRMIIITIWATLTAVFMAPVLAAYAFPENLLLRFSSYLPIPHGHCIFCGMTHAYIALAGNDVSAGKGSNPLSLFGFYGALANALLLLLFLFRAWKAKALMAWRLHKTMFKGGSECKRSA